MVTLALLEIKSLLYHNYYVWLFNFGKEAEGFGKLRLLEYGHTHHACSIECLATSLGHS